VTAPVVGFFEAQMLRISPPWLVRPTGAATMRAIGQQLDVIADRVTLSVKARFPDSAPDDALGKLGVDRRIIRGPAEPATSFARRLRIWWDSHRTEGGPYALLNQLFWYWFFTLDVPIEYVDYSGKRLTLGAALGPDGEPVITRDSIVWGADGSGLPAQYWLFFRLTSNLLPLTIDVNGDYLIAGQGDVIVLMFDLNSGTPLPQSVVDEFTAVPREWTAAHIIKVHIVLLWPGGGRLWEYPQPVPGWDFWTWGGPPAGPHAPYEFIIDRSS
jgi:hypothetical protein